MVLDCSTEGVFKKFSEDVFKVNCYIAREIKKMREVERRYGTHGKVALTSPSHTT